MTRLVRTRERGTDHRDLRIVGSNPTIFFIYLFLLWTIRGGSGEQRIVGSIPQTVKVFSAKFFFFFFLPFFGFSLFVGLILDYSGLKIW